MNDALGASENDAEFGKRLARAVAEVQRGKPVNVAAVGNGCIHVNAATVIETHHSSGEEWVAIGQNYGRVIPFEERWEAEKAIKRFQKRRQARTE